MTIRIYGTDFTPGLYADDCLGHAHVRGVLADYVADILEDIDLAESLRGPISEDASEEVEAIDRLNEVTDDGQWELDNGLILKEV